MPCKGGLSDRGGAAPSGLRTSEVGGTLDERILAHGLADPDHGKADECSFFRAALVAARSRAIRAS